MSFNIFATATSDIPLANLDANFTMIGSSAVASTLYPTATTSITYGTTGTIHYFSGSGLAVTGTLSVAPSGATNPVEIRGLSNFPTYGAISFNSAYASTTILGLYAGASGDTNLHLNAPTTKSIFHEVAGSTITTTSSTGLAVTGTLSSTLGATIYGLTVGRGGGAVSTNTVLGNAAFGSNLTGGYSVAIGTQALQVSTAGYNTAVGYQSQLLTNTGQSNVSVGYYSLVSNLSGGSNTAIGTYALGNTTASNNTAVGYQAGYLSTGAGNQFFGYSSGSAVTSGAKNVILGSYTGSAAPISATGSNYVVLSDGDGNIVASSKTAQTFALQGGTLSAGTGIAFPATQSASTDANTLDDYEEGTFTATLTGSTTNPTTPVTATAAYTKIGNVVNFKISFENVNTTGASGQIIITGLPFTIANGYRVIAPCVFYSIATFTGSPIGMIDNNLASIYFYSSGSTVSWSNVTHNAGTTRYLSVSGFYTTT